MGIGRCYCQFYLFLSDVNTTFNQRCCFLWQMLCHCGDGLYCGWCCATVVDEITLLWLMLLSYWCKTISWMFSISDITIANVNGWCYCHCGWCYCHYCFLLYCGRCNNHLLLADVITKCVMADDFAKYVMADVVAICGRWNSHFMWRADVIAL